MTAPTRSPSGGTPNGDPTIIRPDVVVALYRQLLADVPRLQREAWLDAKRESCPAFTQLGSCHTCEAQAFAKYPPAAHPLPEPAR